MTSFAAPMRSSRIGSRVRRCVRIAMFAVPAALCGDLAVADGASPTYRLSGHVGLGAGKRWDYITVDAPSHRIYLARADRVEVVDTRTLARVGTISGLHGTHGVAIAGALGRGFISDGKGNAVVIFDLASLAVLRTVPVGGNPDAIVFDPATGRVATFNGASHDASILDAAHGDVLALSVPLGGKPEFARVGTSGHVYLNIEDTAEIVDLDLAKPAVHGRYSIAPCEEPTGLALGAAGELVSVCQNHLAVISDPATGKVRSTVAIGAHPDGVVIDDGYAYSANGGDGTISVVPLGPGAGGAVGAIASRRSARTIDADPATHTLYLPALAAAPVPAAGGGAAPAGAAPPTHTDADEIEILVFSRS